MPFDKYKLVLFIGYTVFMLLAFWAANRAAEERDRAEMLHRWYKRQIDETRRCWELLNKAQNDMTTLLDCCDICGNNANPDCPADCEKCAIDCACRTCRNNSKFVWRGLHETERRSGIYDNRGETDESSGDRKEPAETISAAQKRG